MSEIIRRKKAVPVQARRVEPDVINIPGAGAIPLPPATPGVTQNIIIVNAPQGHGGQQAAPQSSEPREIHHHTTNIYQAPRRRRYGRGTSFLGTLGFVLGGVAAGAAYVPPIMWLAKPIAMAAFAFAALGFIGAVLFNRVGKFMPLLGMTVAVFGYYLWLKNSGQPIELPKIDLKIPAAPTAPVVGDSPNAQTTPLQKPAAPVVNKTQPKDHSIFGDGGGAWVGPADAVRSTPLDVAAATANLEKVRQAAAQRMNIDYAGANAAAATAANRYQQASIDDLPGSAELGAASTAHVEADSNLTLIENKLRSDATVSAAEGALKAAKNSAK